ncbi:MAG: diguanylate cyclase [Hydrogenovibrio sp.]
MQLNRIDLRRLILSLATVSVILTLVNALYATYKVQKNLLIDGTLHANEAYATKLARSTAMHLNLVMSELNWSSQAIAQAPQNPSLSQLETERLLRQSDSFNAVVRVNANGQLQALAAPNSFKADVILKDAPIQEALTQQQTRISSPFRLNQGQYFILVSQPIIDEAGHYDGFIGGLINLHDRSILHRLLSDQSYQDETYLYVVDAKHRLIVHPDKTRIGEKVLDNPAIETVLDGQTGHQKIINSQGIHMLAGYSPVGISGWGVVSQRPLHATLATLDKQMLSVLWHSLPILLVTGLIIWLFAGRISKPLWHLAQQAEHPETPETESEVKRIKTWYYEADELKTALLKGFGSVHQHIHALKTESLTDPLTRILNRRGLQQQLETWQLENIPFSVISLDIDHFKAVNDAHGHDVGDQVIQAVTEQMRECSRNQDVLSRTGGEEFLMLLPYTPLEYAVQVAERLRKTMSDAPLKTVGTITISLGVAHWPETAEDIEKVLKQADVALYQAKQTGRNKVCVATDSACQEAMRKWEDILN